MVGVARFELATPIPPTAGQPEGTARYVTKSGGYAGKYPCVTLTSRDGSHAAEMGCFGTSWQHRGSKRGQPRPREYIRPAGERPPLAEAACRAGCSRGTP